METETVPVRPTMPCINANKKFWSEFFELYKSLPSLWDLKHPDYIKREIKAQDCNKLTVKLKELYPDANRDLVVGKINTYRTSFRKELKKIQEYQKRGIPHTPALWYFDNLSFLIDQIQLNRSKTLKKKIVKPPEKVKKNYIQYIHIKSTIKHHFCSFFLGDKTQIFASKT